MIRRYFYRSSTTSNTQSTAVLAELALTIANHHSRSLSPSL